MKSELKNSVIFMGNETSDWKNISASNPIDSLSLSLDDPPEILVEFVKKYDGKFISGFITYEYGVKQLNVPVQDLIDFPAVHFRVYDSFESSNDFSTQSIKNNQQSTNPLSSPTLGKFKKGIMDLNFPKKQIEWDSFQPIISKTDYDSGFEKIQNHIRSGNFYQINYTHSLQSKSNTSPKELFQTLRKKNHVGYSVFMENDDWAIHSLSPEQFIKIENGIITAKPIKGTISRGINAIEDERNLKSLLNSEKEQAELYMIIDLLRNDLGKTCKTGSIQVLESKSIQKLEKIFHTYGVIQGKLKTNIHPIEALLSMSPGGSISGCPKKRACEIIHELEPKSRGIYTGTIGYILPDGTLNFNIAIRTVTQLGENLTLSVGGGITVDSNNENEYKETLAKAASFQP